MMTVRQLIGRLKQVDNKSAKVNLVIPHEMYHTGVNDFETDDFLIDDTHSYIGKGAYIELYSRKEIPINSEEDKKWKT